MQVGSLPDSVFSYRPFSGGVASRLATAIYVAMVTPILYDNSCSPNDSNRKLLALWLIFKNRETLTVKVLGSMVCGKTLPYTIELNT